MGQLEHTVKRNVILVPTSIFGHLNPMMHLGRKLVERGMTCTLLLEERGRRSLEQVLKKYGPATGFQIEWVRTLESKDLCEMFANWQTVGKEFFDKMVQAKSGAPKPTCMIVDELAGWTGTCARKLGIPRYFFISSPALFAYWSSSFSTLMKRDGLRDRVDEDPIIDLPGAPELRLKECPDMSIEAPEFFTDSGDAFHDSAGVLINTFYDLEASVLDHFASQLQARNQRDFGPSSNGSQPPWVYAVGPLSTDRVASDSPKTCACLQWLDSRPAKSVLYVAFGSMSENRMSKAQIWELAVALETTGVSFLWVLIPDCNDSQKATEVLKLLPSGFCERTRDRGLVYPYFSPQVKVLSHPATGTFVTHCGWNSTMECIVSGVPPVGWPRHAEQRLCFRILEEAGLEARVPYEYWDCEKGAIVSVVVDRSELERVIKTWVMEDGHGRKRLVENSAKLQKQASTAVARGGSSFENLERFIVEISQL